jgi:hypothetical protein
MAHLVVHHKVQDFAKWKPIFDEDGTRRKEFGSKGAMVMRTVGDPNDLFIVFEWSSVADARKFTESDELKKTMERAGVVSEPEVYFLEELDETQA